MKRTFYLAQRRNIRKCLKKYLIIFKEDIEKDFGITLPSEIELERMPKYKFVELIDELTKTINSNKGVDSELDELLEIYNLINVKLEKLYQESIEYES